MSLRRGLVRRSWDCEEVYTTADQRRERAGGRSSLHPPFTPISAGKEATKKMTEKFERELWAFRLAPLKRKIGAPKQLTVCLGSLNNIEPMSFPSSWETRTRVVALSEGIQSR